MIENILKIIDFLDKATIVITSITMLAVVYTWYSNRKQLDRIQIYFIDENHHELLLENISIVRKHITRSEVLGILGVIQTNSKERYNIDYLSSTAFFNDLYAIQKGTLNKLFITISAKELEQFTILQSTQS